MIHPMISQARKNRAYAMPKIAPGRIFTILSLVNVMPTRKGRHTTAPIRVKASTRSHVHRSKFTGRGYLTLKQSISRELKTKSHTIKGTNKTIIPPNIIIESWTVFILNIYIFIVLLYIYDNNDHF